MVAEGEDPRQQRRQRRNQRRRPIEPVYRAIGELVSAARVTRGLTQAALGASVGHARLSIVGIENARQRVQVHTLYAIARALAVPVKTLLPDDC